MFHNGHGVTSIVSLILKINALPRCGLMLNFAKDVEGVQNPIHFYTIYESANDLVMLLCRTELRNYLHIGNLQGCSFHLVPNNMGFHHGQILIETETDSLALTYE